MLTICCVLFGFLLISMTFWFAVGQNNWVSWIIIKFYCIQFISLILLLDSCRAVKSTKLGVPAYAYRVAYGERARARAEALARDPCHPSHVNVKSTSKSDRRTYVRPSIFIFIIYILCLIQLSFFWFFVSYTFYLFATTLLVG